MPTKARVLGVVSAAIFAIMLTAGPAAAHTGFDSSSPADGDVIDEPVTEIALTFTGDATPTGEGFVLLDPTGTVRKPDEATTTDNRTWVLGFNSPLAGGDVGVRWTVAAPDTHPINGSFSFTVTAPAPAGANSNAAESGDFEPVDLETFLTANIAEPAAANVIAAVARIANTLGAVLVIGGAAFAVFGFRGDPSDMHAVLRQVQQGGLLLVAGAMGEAATMTATLVGEWSSQTSPTDLAEALWSSAGLAVVLRAAGGIMIASKTDARSLLPKGAHPQLATVQSGADPAAGPSPDELVPHTDDHVRDHPLGLAVLAGVMLVATSFMFDGHTASEGPRWLHSVVNLTHVTAAAVWAGGLVMLALTIHRRRNDNRPTHALQLAMRFSVIATITLIAAGIAGAALSIIVVDSISDVWATTWGRLLVMKVAVVVLAAAGGFYNQRVVVPALDRAPDHRPTIDRFRTVVAVEAVALLCVAAITAFLVAASTT